MRIRYLLLLFLCVCADFLYAQTPALNTQFEYRMRKGLPNFFEKIREGKQIKIGYLGGSITEAVGGWREQSLQKLQERYPAATFTGINAGVGGTGSDLGVFRVQKDVIDHEPDLVFVEFAVNDAGLPPKTIQKAMEGIVRKIWRFNKHTDICFVYTMMEQMVDTLKTGSLWPSMLAMEQIAEHYGIPSVMFAKPVMDLYNSGHLVFTGNAEKMDDKIVFSRDRVHPYPTTGHRIYTEALMKFFETAEKNAGRLTHHLSSPFTRDNWEDAVMLPASVLTQSGTWNNLSNTNDSVAVRLQNRFPYLISSDEVGASIQMQFKGRSIGLYDVVGPGCGQFQVKVDQHSPVLIPRFDKYAAKWRSHYFFLPEEMNEGTHDVVFSVSEEKLDKSSIVKDAGKFQRGTNSADNLDPYSKNACYAGWVLLLGKPVRRNK
ncbi:SGNH/GDSL hydrolase family protein [Chitinophagaceae bacterium 26-R-25]|nr:SGNH/GDSL hydrolase family protein [Chitinophagaceae bacterium 26-R-25]